MIAGVPKELCCRGHTVAQRLSSPSLWTSRQCTTHTMQIYPMIRSFFKGMQHKVEVAKRNLDLYTSTRNRDENIGLLDFSYPILMWLLANHTVGEQFSSVESMAFFLLDEYDILACLGRRF